MDNRYEFMCKNCLKVFVLYMTCLRPDDNIDCPYCNMRNNCRCTSDNNESRQWNLFKTEQNKNGGLCE